MNDDRKPDEHNHREENPGSGLAHLWQNVQSIVEALIVAEQARKKTKWHEIRNVLRAKVTLTVLTDK